MPEPMWTPTRSAFSGVDLQAGHLHGFVRGRDGEVDEAPHLLYFFLLDELQRIEVLDLGGDPAGEGGGIEAGDPAPHRSCPPAGPSTLLSVVIADAADQADAGDDDSSRQTYFRLSRLVDIVNGVLHGADLLRVFVRDLDFEGFFERHHQFDGVQRVGAQVVHERGVGGHFAFVHSQLLDNDLLNLFVNGCHVCSSLKEIYRDCWGKAKS